MEEVVRINADELWSLFGHDPRDPAHRELRASDADRERIRSVLADAFADGRLDREEYDERSATLLDTRTMGALPALVTDLVPDRSPAVRPSGAVDITSAPSSDIAVRAQEKWESQRRSAIFSFLGPTLICWAVWVVAGMDWGVPWPLIVMAATGFGALRTLTNKRGVIADEVRRLERKQIAAQRKKALAPPEEPSS